MYIFEGSAVAMVTPFNEDLSVNYDKVKELIEFHIKNGTNAILINGTTGESPNISDEEFEKLIKLAVETIDKRVPLIAGTGSNSTSHSLALSKKAEELGADALLLITPYYNKATQEGVLQHFTYVADRVNLPIILYNVPGRTSVNLEPETVYKASQHKNIVAVKEASGNISQVVKIRSLCDKEFAIYSGNDDIIIPTMACHGQGVISVLANVAPKAVSDMTRAYLDGELDKAIDMQMEYTPLIEALFTEPNPIAVKCAMNHMDMNVGPARLPLTPLAKGHEEQLLKALKDLKMV